MTGERIERFGEDERAEAYLDGDLSREEAAAFERDLARRPEVADALGAAILLRELLGAMPPLAPPPGLEERIVAALPPGRGGEQREAGARERRSAVSSVRAALSGASWLVRPSAAVVHGGVGGARQFASGVAQLRWLVGPLGTSRSEGEPAPRRGLWRRVLGRVG